MRYWPAGEKGWNSSHHNTAHPQTQSQSKCKIQKCYPKNGWYVGMGPKRLRASSDSSICQGIEGHPFWPADSRFPAWAVRYWPAGEKGWNSSHHNTAHPQTQSQSKCKIQKCYPTPPVLHRKSRKE